MVKIALFNNKGGVGKSTATINIAHAMTRLGKFVLVVDCDSQQNTFSFFANMPVEENGCFEQTRYENLDIVFGSDITIERHIKGILTNNEYDYVIFDLPPALDERTRAIVSKCDYVFVPFELGKFAIQGIAKVTEAIAITGVNFGGCFVNKFDRENPTAYELNELLRKTLGEKVMSTKIPSSRVIKNSIDYRMTAFEYMEWMEAVGAYTELTKEIMTICREVE